MSMSQHDPTHLQTAEASARKSAYGWWNFAGADDPAEVLVYLYRGVDVWTRQFHVDY
jgi:1,4-alpha-glucan branching enzyme